LALFAAAGIFTIAALVLITVGLIASIEPLRAMQAAKNAPAAAQGQPAANLLAAAEKIDTTNAWIVFGLISGTSALLLVVAWLTLRPYKRLSIRTFNPMIYSTLAVVTLGLMTLLLKVKDMPAEITGLLWPFILSVLAIPFPVSYIMLRWFGWRMGRAMERLSYTPVNFDDLPAATRQHFEQFTPQMEELGFRHLADYRLKQNAPFFCRVMLSEDNCTFGEIVTQRFSSLLTIKCCALATIFESGDYLESADIASKNYDSVRNHTRSVPGADLEVLYAEHEATVQEISEQNGTFPVECTPEDYPKVSTYGHKLMFDRLVKEGVMGRNIYDDAETAV
jgi:hypothetical protein